MVLKVEDNHTLEWVDIDPEAFTGKATLLASKVSENIVGILVLLQSFCIYKGMTPSSFADRKWRVGDQTQAC